MIRTGHWGKGPFGLPVTLSKPIFSQFKLKNQLNFLTYPAVLTVKHAARTRTRACRDYFNDYYIVWCGKICV